jgi:hypothetical protein
VDLLCLDSGSGETCLSYTEGKDLEFQDAYSGLFITEVYTGGPAFLRTCKVTGSISAGAWTRVELRANRSTGATQVLLNGTNGATACNLTYLVDSAAEVRVGLEGSTGVQRAFSAYYDNVEAYVLR